MREWIFRQLCTVCVYMSMNGGMLPLLFMFSLFHMILPFGNSIYCTCILQATTESPVCYNTVTVKACFFLGKRSILHTRQQQKLIFINIFTVTYCRLGYQIRMCLVTSFGTLSILHTKQQQNAMYHMFLLHLQLMQTGIPAMSLFTSLWDIQQCSSYNQLHTVVWTHSLYYIKGNVQEKREATPF